MSQHKHKKKVTWAGDLTIDSGQAVICLALIIAKQTDPVKITSLTGGHHDPRH